ncbi:MAG: hypothetical protein WBQ17_12985 [Rhizomicrobium sp.]|jgi:hypothetical protein
MNDWNHAGYDPEDADFGRPDGNANLRKGIERMIQASFDTRFGRPGTVEKPLPAEPIALDDQVNAPGATEALLNAQLLECVGMVRDAGSLYRNSPIEPNDRGYFINHASKLMEMSAQLAGAINRLRGAPEPVKTTRHVVAIERVGGRGPAKPENE